MDTILKSASAGKPVAPVAGTGAPPSETAERARAFARARRPTHDAALVTIAWGRRARDHFDRTFVLCKPLENQLSSASGG
jgi:hypothetical protein